MSNYTYIIIQNSEFLKGFYKNFTLNIKLSPFSLDFNMFLEYNIRSCKNISGAEFLCIISVARV